MNILDKREIHLVSGGATMAVPDIEYLADFITSSTSVMASVLGAGLGIYLGTGIASQLFGCFTGGYTGASLTYSTMSWALKPKVSRIYQR